MRAADAANQPALAVRWKVKQMSLEDARARFLQLKSQYLIGEETDEILLLAERLGEVGEIWTFDFEVNEWRPRRAQKG